MVLLRLSRLNFMTAMGYIDTKNIPTYMEENIMRSHAINFDEEVNYITVVYENNQDVWSMCDTTLTMSFVDSYEANDKDFQIILSEMNQIRNRIGLHVQGVSFESEIIDNEFYVDDKGIHGKGLTDFTSQNNSDKTVIDGGLLNTKQIGESEKRVEAIYLSNQPNVNSDLRLKFAVQDIPQDLLDCLVAVEPKMYAQGKDWHFGYIAHDVEKALYKWALKRYGRDAKYYVERFAFLHKSTSYMSLLYGEIAVIKERQLLDRIERLESKINKRKPYRKRPMRLGRGKK